MNLRQVAKKLKVKKLSKMKATSRQTFSKEL